MREELNLTGIKNVCKNQGMETFVQSTEKAEQIVNAAREAHTAWLGQNAECMQPDLSNHYTSRQASTEFAHAMLRLGNALDGN